MPVSWRTPLCPDCTTAAVGPLDVECVLPAGRPRHASVAMGAGHPREKRLGDVRGVGRLLDEIDVMDVARWVKLRHKKGIHVPKFRLHQGPTHLLEAHTHQLGLHRIQKFAVRMLLPNSDPRRTEIDGVFSEPLGRQLPSFSNSGLS